MIDPIIKLINPYKYKLSSHSYGLLCLKKARKIQIETDASAETFIHIFNQLKQAFGDPVYVHSYYGFIFVNSDKFIAYNTIEETYGCVYPDIFIFNKIPSGKKISYDTYMRIDNDIKSVADENGFHYEGIMHYSKDMLAFTLISDKNLQVLAFIQSKEIAYYISEVIKSDNLTKAIPKGYGKEAVNRDDAESIRHALNKILGKVQSIQ